MSLPSSSWSEYYQLTKDQPPSELLVQARAFVGHTGKALDVGGGALKDSRYLLEQGFEVTAVDKDPLVAQMAKDVLKENLHVVIADFTDVDFGVNQYDIASAMFSLPFISPEAFETVFRRIQNSLVKGGIFCGQFFGVRDEWHSNANMTFHTKAQVGDLLSDMDILSCVEKEKDGKTANGTPKHWHVFHVIARK